MYQFLMVGDNLLVEFDTGDEHGEKKTDSGLILKAEVETNVVIGTVVVAGPGKLSLMGTRSECLTKVGDEIHFLRAHAVSLTIKGKKYYVVSETNVLGYLTPIEENTSTGE